MKFKAELDEAMRHKCCYKGNYIKAYMLLWELCSKLMKNKLKERADFQSSIYNDPINLLIAIKQHSQDFQDQRYEKENEVLQDYTRRFKTMKDVVESHIRGGLQLTKYAAILVDLTTTKGQSLQKASEHLFAFMYLKNVDQAKYSSVLTNLNQQKSVGNNQYTKT
eukprot:8516869-Ditylum_brightwellii.AAC.1